MIIDRLYDEILEKGPICIGLDTKYDYLPQFIISQNISLEEKLFNFNKRIIDATYDLTACYKVQIACYEGYGLEGMKAYSRTVKYIREKGKISIGDIKRGDISSTAEMYGKAHFEGDFEVDFITVNPYMGIDAISPYFKYLKTGEKGMFVLIKTSNKSSNDFQCLETENQPLYIKVAEKVNEWGKEFIGKSGFSLVGGVVGSNNLEEFNTIKDVCKNTLFLIPGYGAQGGSGKDIGEMFNSKVCGVVNSSRGIITSHKGISEDESFIKPIRESVIKMKEDIENWLR